MRTRRYLAAGVCTKILDVTLFGILFGALDSILLANVISSGVCLFFNYLAHNYWTFPNQVPMKKSALRYGSQTIVGWTLETILLIGANNIGLNIFFAKSITTAFFSVMSLVLLDNWVFK